MIYAAAMHMYTDSINMFIKMSPNTGSVCNMKYSSNYILYSLVIHLNKTGHFIILVCGALFQTEIFLGTPPVLKLVI
jgi:hypothetical protein